MATTQRQLRRELLTGIRDTELDVDALIAELNREIARAARQNGANKAEFRKRVIVALVAFWGAYRLLQPTANKTIAGAVVSYVDASVGRALVRVGASQTFQALKLSTYADDVAKAVLTRKNVYDGGTIQQRIVTLRRGSEKVVRDMINRGFAQGLTVNDVARSIQHYVNPMSQAGRRFTAGNGINYKAVARGRNLPKGAIRYNAVRIARSEMMLTYDQAMHQYYEGKPWSKGWRWILSNTHVGEDICDIMAKGSPYKKPQSRPHPQCTCDQQPDVMSLSEFEQLVKSGKIK